MTMTYAEKLCAEPEIEPDALPCPFCGGPATIEWINGARMRARRRIGCRGMSAECHVEPSVTGDTKAEALDRWNTRVR